jgi:hypothetical protein
VPDWILIALIPLVLVAAWAPILFLVSTLGGWRRLADHFPANDPPTGRQSWMQSLSIGWASYSNCLTIYVSADGLYLSVMLPFRPGHPPIFIPWSEIHDMTTRRQLWVEDVVFDVGSPSVAKLTLSRKVFEGRDVTA